MRIFEWAIEDIVDAYPSLSLEHAMACAVTLMRDAGKPCSFSAFVENLAIDQLEGDSQFLLDVTWTEKTEAVAIRMERTEQRTPIVERAAIALSALLLCHLVSGSELEVLKQTSRADYVLRQHHQAVEISGTQHAREISRRRREKSKQGLENIHGMNCHVMVCCFDNATRMIQWSYHSQPG